MLKIIILRIFNVASREIIFFNYHGTCLRIKRILAQGTLSKKKYGHIFILIFNV